MTENRKELKHKLQANGMTADAEVEITSTATEITQCRRFSSNHHGRIDYVSDTLVS